jgi:NAD+ kinase
MRAINRVKIYCNNNKLSNEVLIKLTDILTENNYEIVDTNPDLAIAIGGDGAFLRMVKSENYNNDIIYVGINAGTLGFLQEVKIDEINDFIHCLNDERYSIEEVGLQKTIIKTKEKEDTYCSLNEILVRESELNTVFLDVSIDENKLESFAGDGLLIATSIGSTAYNLSFGGSIVYEALHTLQITPIAPLNNKAYRNLLNSVIVPEKTQIVLIPSKDKNNLLISIDGENRIYNDVDEINTRVSDKKLKFIRLKNYNYWKTINDKFLSS